MNANLSPDAAAAVALAELLTARPELSGLKWKVCEQPGVLVGEQITETGTGELIDLLADLAGGTVVRSTADRGDDRLGIAQLVTEYDGVPVHVWVSYPLAGPHGLTTTALAALLAGRTLGTLTCLPGGTT